MAEKRDLLREIILDGITGDLSFSGVLRRLSATLRLDSFIFDLTGRILHGSSESERDDILSLRRAMEHDGAALPSDAPHEFSFPDGSHWMATLMASAEIPEKIACVGFYDPALRESALTLLSLLPRLESWYSGADTSPLAVSDNYIEIGFAQELLFKKSDGDDGVFTHALSMRTEGSRSLFEPQFCVAVFSGANISGLKNAALSLGQYLNNTLHFIRNGRLYIFLHGITGRGQEVRTGRALSRFASEHHLCCGMSAFYTDMGDSPALRRQAELASELASRKGVSFADADEYYVQLLFSAILSERHPEPYILSELNRLEAYDRENHTNYVRTLEVYLTHFNRPSLAAPHLYIDRSTLAYRLQKIHEILQRDVDDPEESGLLKTALVVHRLVRGGETSY